MTTVQLYTKWGKREVEMHELHPYINRTRIRFGKKFQQLKILGFLALNLDSQRGL